MQVCRRLADQGVPLKTDLERAWLDFAGWRVNYDAALLSICSMTLAPFAQWSSDRAPDFELASIRPRLKHMKRLRSF